MASKTKNLKVEKKAVGNEKYLNDVFVIMKQMNNLSVSDRSTRFSNTEMRLLGEIMAYRYVGQRLISTQLADLLGLTRSAISQIVNRLEAQGIVKRVADDVDRKIAYIEITEEFARTSLAEWLRNSAWKDSTRCARHLKNSVHWLKRKRQILLQKENTPNK